MLSQFITVSTGQCGVQINNALWETYCIEHGINQEGVMYADEKTNIHFNQSIFTKSYCGEYVPKNIILDMEPSVVDEVRTGIYRDLFDGSLIINTLEDGANVFARGLITHGKKLLKKCKHQFFRQAEECDLLKGFLMHFGAAGGTGGGFSSLLMGFLNDEFTKKDIVTNMIYPSKFISSFTVEPYNVTLAHPFLVKESSVVTVSENASLYDLTQNLNCIWDMSLPLKSVKFNDINRLYAQMVNDMTINFRCESVLTNDFMTVQTNLIPYPKLKFVSASYGALIRGADCVRNLINLTVDLFRSSNCFLQVDLSDATHTACDLIFRGNVSPSFVNAATAKLKCQELAKFVPWSPCGFKIGITRTVPFPLEQFTNYEISATALLLSNSSHSVKPMEHLLKRMNLLWNKRAFIHHFVEEGMEEGEIQEAKESLVDTISDYNLLTIDAGVSENTASNETDYMQSSQKSQITSISPKSNSIDSNNTSKSDGRDVFDNTYSKSSDTTSSNNSRVRNLLCISNRTLSDIKEETTEEETIDKDPKVKSIKTREYSSEQSKKNSNKTTPIEEISPELTNTCRFSIKGKDKKHEKSSKKLKKSHKA